MKQAFFAGCIVDFFFSFDRACRQPPNYINGTQCIVNENLQLFKLKRDGKVIDCRIIHTRENSKWIFCSIIWHLVVVLICYFVTWL